jgi:hypothetical protein
MEKTVICKYWKNKNCKFMENAEKCMYAHGDDYITIVNCKYGINCYNSKCKFNHGEISTIPNMVYNIPIIDKRKKQKIKKIIKNKNHDNISKNKENNLSIIEKEENIPLKSIIPYSEDILKNTTNVKIVNKEKGIEENIDIFNKDYDKTLSIIDRFYIEKYNNTINDKNKYIRQIVFNNYKNIYYLRKINNNKDEIINKLNSENRSLKKVIEELKTNNEKKKKENIKYQHTINNMVDIKNKKIYDKYICLYEIFNKYKYYKLINMEEIRKYTNDKNIYKVKQRSFKVFKFYEKFKDGTIKDLLPLSTIFKMVF